MHLGIFAKTFPRPTLDDLFAAVAHAQLSSVQFNLSCVQLPTLPDSIPDSLAHDLNRAAAHHGIQCAALSATFNLIHPNPAHVQSNLSRLATLARFARAARIPTLTLCTGTRDPNDMWKSHPENQSPDAWKTLVQNLSRALEITESTGVQLGVEPELANVVNSAQKARQLLDELQSPRLGIIFDGANLLQPTDLPRAAPVWQEAAHLLHDRVILAHAKELNAAGHPEALGPGQGVLPWHTYFETLQSIGFSGAVILHGLDEPHVPQAVRHLQSCLS